MNIASHVARRTMMCAFIALATVGGSTGAMAQTTTPSPPPSETPAPTPAPSPTYPNFDQQRNLFKELDLENTNRSSRALGRAYESAAMFARCAAHLDAPDVRALLAEPVGSKTETMRVQSLAARVRVCAIGRAAVPVSILRGALAEAMLLRQGAVPTSPTAETLNVERYRAYERDRSATAAVNATPEAVLRNTVRCLAVLGPGLARDIFAQKLGSKAELAAFRTLYERVPVCGGDQFPERIAISIQRAALAEALYQWLETAPNSLKRASLKARARYA